MASEPRSSVALYVRLFCLFAACMLPVHAVQQDSFLRATNFTASAACSSFEQAQASPAHLYQYGTLDSQVTMIHGRGHRNVVFVGGLGSGLLALPWVDQLGQTLSRAEWVLAEAQLRSCFGVRCVALDCCVRPRPRVTNRNAHYHRIMHQ